MQRHTTHNGFGLAEVVVGASILAITLFGMVIAFNASLELSRVTTARVHGLVLLEEGKEAVRLLRDMSWENISTLTPGADYYLDFSGGMWATSTTPLPLIDGMYERKFVVADVVRDAGDDIAGSGTLDTGTRKATVSVAWSQRGATTTEVLDMYLTNIK